MKNKIDIVGLIVRLSTALAVVFILAAFLGAGGWG